MLIAAVVTCLLIAAVVTCLLIAAVVLCLLIAAVVTCLLIAAVVTCLLIAAVVTCLLIAAVVLCLLFVLFVMCVKWKTDDDILLEQDEVRCNVVVGKKCLQQIKEFTYFGCEICSECEKYFGTTVVFVVRL
jgi:hypothetical protein